MKNYLVVGHSSGIGGKIAERLSREHMVFGTHFQHEPQYIADTRSSHFLDVRAENPDFSFLPESIDGLVYCPGSIQLKPFSRMKAEDFLEDYQLQVLGAVKSIQQCLPKLKNSENPSIVLFSTVAVGTGFNFHSMVSAHKGAIEGLTRALAAELAPKIRVNCIAPSITDTPLAAHLLNTPEKREANAQRHPLKKIGTAEDVANAAIFLLGIESSWITGQVLGVDGGMSTIK